MITLSKNLRQNKEAGSVFFYILIAIFLFAALTYFFSDSSRTNVNMVDEEQAKVLSQEIIEYGDVIATAIQKLSLRGCNDDEISIQRDWNNSGSVTDIAADGFNPNAPSDNSCNIFSNNGGNINYLDLRSGTLSISGAHRFTNMGCSLASDSCSELTYAVKGLNENICTQINNELGFNLNVIPSDTNGEEGLSLFTAYPAGGGSEIGDEDANLENKQAACYNDTNDNIYIYYQVLIIR